MLGGTIEIMRRYQYELFADYFQFYLQDEGANGDLSDSWTEDAVSNLFAVAPGVVGVGTVRNMDVPVTVEVFDAEPESNFGAWDHVTECSLDVASGKVVVAGCTEYFPDAARINLSSGSYRVRTLYGSLGTLSEDGLDGDDQYVVQLWLAPRSEPSVLKARSA